VVRVSADRGPGAEPDVEVYAISALAEARAYLDHPELGPRLRQCAEILITHQDETAERIFGGIDAMKLRSSMTLFMHAAPEQSAFRQVINQFFGGVPDPATEQRL
jgi:uncharacterized protein (DUF1810 family)